MIDSFKEIGMVDPFPEELPDELPLNPNFKVPQQITDFVYT